MREERFITSTHARSNHLETGERVSGEEASKEMGGVEVGRAAALRMIVIVEGEIAKKCNSRLLPRFPESEPIFPILPSFPTE